MRNIPDRLKTLELLESDTRTMTLVDLGFLAITLNEPALASMPAASGSQPAGGAADEDHAVSHRRRAIDGYGLRLLPDDLAEALIERDQFAGAIGDPRAEVNLAICRSR